MPIDRQSSALSLIALGTWAAVSWQLWLIAPRVSWFGHADARPWVLLLCLGYAVGVIWLHWLDRRGDERRTSFAPLLLLALSSSPLVYWSPDSTAPVLWVILASMAAFCLDRRILFILIGLALTSFYVAQRVDGDGAPLLKTVLYGGFIGFATLVSMYARRDQERVLELRELNASLLATRSLLAEIARDAERLRLSRELHDVAGHGLTALRLNLLALQRDLPAPIPPALTQSVELTEGLLADLRGVVRQLRQHDGLDLVAALEALARAVPDQRVRVTVAEDARVADTEVAEALLRITQEALTNSLRHGRASHVDVRLMRHDGDLQLSVSDDGRVVWPLREGHGLTGMRERLRELGGQLRLQANQPQGLQLVAELPGAAA
jgi:signal transduction histidine kinase